MRMRNVVAFSTLAAIIAGFAVGCDQGTNVDLAKVPVLKAAPTTPLPKEAQKGGGPGSSGNSSRDPGASN